MTIESDAVDAANSALYGESDNGVPGVVRAVLGTVNKYLQGAKLAERVERLWHEVSTAPKHEGSAYRKQTQEAFAAAEELSYWADALSPSERAALTEWKPQ